MFEHFFQCSFSEWGWGETENIESNSMSMSGQTPTIVTAGE